MNKVIIIYGGDSDEYKISELTAKSIYDHIDRDKFSPSLLDLNDFRICLLYTSDAADED